MIAIAAFALGIVGGIILGAGGATWVLFWAADRNIRFKLVDIKADEPTPGAWIQPAVPPAHPLDPDGLMGGYQDTSLPTWNAWMD